MSLAAEVQKLRNAVAERDKGVQVELPSDTRILTGYDPRPLQDDMHKALNRFNVLVCHRRFGKTV